MMHGTMNIKFVVFGMSMKFCLKVQVSLNPQKCKGHVT